LPERGLAFTKCLDPASLVAPTVAVEAVRQTMERVLEAICSSAAVALEYAVQGGTVRATIDNATVRQASDALQQAGVFLSNVTDLPPSQEGHQWFTSTLHALDHAGPAIILIVGALTFAYGRFVEGIPFVEMFQAVTGIAVSMIPEGLPALITITLAIGVQRMASRNAIVRRLPAVETLGSVARICSDKTGTLTLMEMMVVSAVTADATHQITGEGYDSEGEVLQDGAPVGEDTVLQLLGRVSALCNDAQLRCEDGVWKVEGDPTEGALYPFAAKIGLDRQKEQAAYPRIDVIPFESEHRFMATLHTVPEGGQVLLVKGAPEVIMDNCDRQEDKTGQHPPIEREHFRKASDTLAAQGERVLALAWLPNPGLEAGSLSPADLPKNLVLLGLIGLLDPPRKEAVEAVKECHAGGIRVTMITGDHKITAAAIAKMLDIGDGKTAIAGAEIAEMDTATLQERVCDVDVFARASPEHKLRLVKARSWP
jgi:magnesium-transporting ATPase (P-type)